MNNYQDYFIKDGKHLGLYEEMYKNCTDPWNIKALGLRPDMRVAFNLLENFGDLQNLNSILDLACGNGLFSNFMAHKIKEKNPQASFLAGDISPSAVKIAQNDYPQWNFQVLDLGHLEQLKGQTFDLIIMAQALWSILEGLPRILKDINSLCARYLLISQHFLREGQQGYGQEIIKNPSDLIKFLEKANFKITATLETNRFTNHHLALLAEKNGL